MLPDRRRSGWQVRSVPSRQPFSTNDQTQTQNPAEAGFWFIPPRLAAQRDRALRAGAAAQLTAGAVITTASSTTIGVAADLEVDCIPVTVPPSTAVLIRTAKNAAATRAWVEMVLMIGPLFGSLRWTEL